MITAKGCVRSLESLHPFFMREAINLALRSAAELEVPVGCVIVRDNQIIAAGRNRREFSKNALAHAEIEAISLACKALGGWRLPRCTLYVTLEPCPMCAGAIINARLERVCFGAADPKAGAFGSVLDLPAFNLNHKPDVIPGILADDCAALLSDFFKNLRVTKRRPDCVE